MTNNQTKEHVMKNIMKMKNWPFM